VVEWWEVVEEGKKKGGGALSPTPIPWPGKIDGFFLLFEEKVFSFGIFRVRDHSNNT